MVPCRCPKCSVDLVVEDASTGQVQCGSCGFIFPLPETTSAPTALGIEQQRPRPRKGRLFLPLQCPNCGAELTGEQTECDRCGFTFNVEQHETESYETRAKANRRARIKTRLLRMAAWCGMGALFFVLILMAIPFLILGIQNSHGLEFGQWALLIGGFLAIFYGLSALPMGSWFPDRDTRSDSLILDMVESTVDEVLKDPLAPDEDASVTAIDIGIFLFGVGLLYLAVKWIF